jgi:pilus assembly protein CpaB
MGRWRAIVPILLAICIAVAGSYLTFRWVKSQVPAQQQATAHIGPETVSVVVAGMDLSWGTQIDTQKVKEMVRVAPFLKESLPQGYFADIPSIEGRVLIFPVKQGELILESKLAPTSVTTGGVAAVVKPGKRAIAVKGDKVIGLSGLVHPGNRVDVLVTIEDPRNKTQVTKIVLEDVPVLATGIEVEKSAEGESPVDVYTLEVTPEEGERLALASAEGKLQFALRNATDTETVLTTGATIPEALASFRPVPVRREGTKIVPRRTQTVQIIKGTKANSETFLE